MIRFLPPDGSSSSFTEKPGGEIVENRSDGRSQIGRVRCESGSGHPAGTLGMVRRIGPGVGAGGTGGTVQVMQGEVQG